MQETNRGGYSCYQVTQCDEGVSLHSKTSTVDAVQQWHTHTVLCIPVSLQSLYVPSKGVEHQILTSHDVVQRD